MNKFILLVLPLTLCTSCGSNSSKYGANKYITENGTTYVFKEAPQYHIYFFKEIMLLADGTGSATLGFSSETSTWNFHYIIDNETQLYFPNYTGSTIYATFSYENNTRYLTQSSIKYIEFTENTVIKNTLINF